MLLVSETHFFIKMYFLFLPPSGLFDPMWQLIFIAVFKRPQARGFLLGFTKFDRVCNTVRQCVASLVSFVSRMPKHVDNIDLTSGAGVKLKLLIYVQEEASLSLIAVAIHLVLTLRDGSCWFGQSSSAILN